MEEPAAAQQPDRHAKVITDYEIIEGMTRWELIWKVVVFQFKLVIDGFRDLILSPLSLISALLGILASPNNPGYFFTRLIHWGRHTERWINLFDHRPEERDDRSVDDYIQHIETVIRRDHARGGVSAATQQAVDSLLDKLRNGGKTDFRAR